MKTFVGLVESGLIIACVLFYLRLAVRGNSVRHALQVWLDMPRRAATKFALTIWLVVFAVDLIETKSDAAITRVLGIDFTPLISGIEGSTVATLQQRIAWMPASAVLAVAYLILFPALVVGSAHAYDR